MGWWFGRKSAPGDLRPYVPAWLSAAEEEGFARSPEGMSVHVRTSGNSAVYRGGIWTVGALTAEKLMIGGNQVVGARSAAVTGPTGGTIIAVEARTAINQILSSLRQHGLIAT